MQNEYFQSGKELYTLKAGSEVTLRLDRDMTLRACPSVVRDDAVIEIASFGKIVTDNMVIVKENENEAAD